MDVLQQLDYLMGVSKRVDLRHANNRYALHLHLPHAKCGRGFQGKVFAEVVALAVAHAEQSIAEFNAPPEKEEAHEIQKEEFNDFEKQLDAMDSVSRPLENDILIDEDTEE